MGKKYIIELLDDCPSEFKGIIVFGLTPEGQISAEPIPVEDLTPYTEPDLEQEQEEQIQVGDEIETPSGLKGYVVNFTDDELVHYVSSEGRFGTMGMSAVSKTGRHFPEIAEVLQKMKE